MDLAAAALAWTRTAPAGEFTVRQLALLGLVCDMAAFGPGHVRDLAKELKVSKPVITRAVNSLEKLGLVKRVRIESDKRCCLVSATDAGHALRAAMERLA